MATGTIMTSHCKQIYTDSTNATFTISQNFKEIEFCVADNSGTSMPRISLKFAKGVAIRKRIGWYASSDNHAFLDVNYDGISTYTVGYYKNGSGVTPYSNVFVYT